MLQAFWNNIRLWVWVTWMNHHLLLIGDDMRSARHLVEALISRGYSVVAASKFEFLSDHGLADGFDLIMIDHSEPRLNAMEICADLRRRDADTPVLVLAARDQLQQRLAIFRAGADDYLVKPIDMDELQVRIEALLRRLNRNTKPEIFSYEFGGRCVDFRQSELVRNGSKVGLSEREARLLRYFVQNRGKIISRSALLQHVWGYSRAPLTRTVDVHVLRLRHKIEDNPSNPRFIVTVPGFGYRFDG
jgi:two-component system alkaline phosphatase synthesis response regulator PhoP